MMKMIPKMSDFAVGMACAAVAIALVAISIESPAAPMPSCPPVMHGERLASVVQDDDRVTCYYAAPASYGKAPARIRIAGWAK
jgi:hypothetical protein